MSLKKLVSQFGLETWLKVSFPHSSWSKARCPLSPLLFVLCVDPLLNRLIAADHDAWAYCDDIAVGIDASSNFVEIIECFLFFQKASHLELNLEKTHFLSTLTPSNIDNECRSRSVMAMGLDPCDPRLLQFREQSVYLGFPFGKAITHTKIFKPVFGKFKKRIMAYSKIRKDLSIQQKVVIANVFLLPLFYYIGTLLKTSTRHFPTSSPQGGSSRALISFGLPPVLVFKHHCTTSDGETSHLSCQAKLSLQTSTGQMSSPHTSSIRGM